MSTIGDNDFGSKPLGTRKVKTYNAMPEVRPHSDPLRGGDTIISLRRLDPNIPIRYEGETVNVYDFPNSELGDENVAADLAHEVRKERRFSKSNLAGTGRTEPGPPSRLSTGLLKKLGKAGTTVGGKIARAVGGKALGVAGTALDFKEFHQTMEGSRKKRESIKKRGYYTEPAGEL